MRDRIEIRLKERMKEQNINQRQLADMTGLSEQTINELANKLTENLPLYALGPIADVLEITNLNDLVTLVADDDKDDDE